MTCLRRPLRYWTDSYFSEVPKGIRTESFIPQLNVKYSLQDLDSLSCDYFSAGEEYTGHKNGYQFLC